MRVVAQDVAILGGPGLGLVGVAEDVLLHAAVLGHEAPLQAGREACAAAAAQAGLLDHLDHVGRRDLLGQDLAQRLRSEEHTSELQSLMRISYAVFCLKKKT